MIEFAKSVSLIFVMFFSMSVCSATIVKDCSESGDSISVDSNEDFEIITVRELITRNRDYSYQVCADAADSTVVTAMYNRWVEGFSSAGLMDSIALWGLNSHFLFICSLCGFLCHKGEINTKYWKSKSISLTTNINRKGKLFQISIRASNPTKQTMQLGRQMLARQSLR